MIYTYMSLAKNIRPYRIHCWRLYKVKSNTDGALDQSTVDILEDLYFQTNCGLQLCSSLLTSDTLPTVRKILAFRESKGS